MLVCALCCARCTRDRGCSAHPVFPAPSDWRGRERMANLGRNEPREGEFMSINVIARSPCDEAIHLPARGASGDMNCFAVLAMTVSRFKSEIEQHTPSSS